jgi:hypothetical protein
VSVSRALASAHPVLGELPTGMVFPEAVVHSAPFSVLAAFVAINTVMYGVLALAKMLPKVYPSSLVRGRNRRAQNRSIDPGPPARVSEAAADVRTADAGT